MQNKMLLIAVNKNDGTLFLSLFQFFGPLSTAVLLFCLIYDYKYDDGGLVGAAVSRREWRDGAHRKRNVYEIT